MPVAKWPAMLGEAQANRVAPIAGDAVSLEIVLGALGDPVHLFGGIRDFNTPLIVRQGQVQTSTSLTDAIRAYVGGWPRPHLIDRYLGRPSGPLDADGIARTGGLFDLWFRRADDFFLFSFKRDVLLEVGRQLAIVDAERPAQIRLHIDDLSNKQIATAVNGYGYMRARDTSASASRFMNSLTTQLHVPAENARALGETLVGGKFTCPLGGKYVLADPNAPTPPAAFPDGAVASGTVTPTEQLPAPKDPVGATSSDAINASSQKTLDLHRPRPRKSLPPHGDPRRLPDASHDLVPRPLGRRCPPERRALAQCPTRHGPHRSRPARRPTRRGRRVKPPEPRRPLQRLRCEAG